MAKSSLECFDILFQHLANSVSNAEWIHDITTIFVSNIIILISFLWEGWLRLFNKSPTGTMVQTPKMWVQMALRIRVQECVPKYIRGGNKIWAQFGTKYEIYTELQLLNQGYCCWYCNALLSAQFKREFVFLLYTTEYCGN